jgi:hypothetical protein
MLELTFAEIFLRDAIADSVRCLGPGAVKMRPDLQLNFCDKRIVPVKKMARP